MRFQCKRGKLCSFVLIYVTGLNHPEGAIFKPINGRLFFLLPIFFTLQTHSEKERMNSFSLSSCRAFMGCDSGHLMGRRDLLLSGPGSAGRMEISAPNGRRRSRILAVGEVAGAASDPVRAEITWQIVVGALAGVVPFVVAGVEFSKRIIAQRRCGVCGGSGLVLRENNYFRCPGCGGFLPWQSWRRFFSG